MRDTTELQDRIFKFVVATLLFLRSIKNSSDTIDNKRQLNNSATSTGANYEESQAGSSQRDSKNKIAIALKEMRESNYWLRLFFHLQIGDMKQCSYLVKESHELKNILGSIYRKLQ